MEVLNMNKATVFQIGNRLAKTMDRLDAFVQAWQVVKSGAVSFSGNKAQNKRKPKRGKRLLAQ
jgi:hypothetical protein